MSYEDMGKHFLNKDWTIDITKKDWTFEFLTANWLFNIIVLFSFSLDSASPPFICLFIFEYSQYKI